MQRTTQWYPSFAEHTFPTVFLRLTADEIQVIKDDSANPAVKKHLEERLQQAMNSLIGKSFIALDSCAPTDAADFAKGKAQNTATGAIKLLQSSDKIRTALKNGDKHIVIRPYRRMDKTREFRLFIADGELKAMSQYCLERHFRRLEGRRAEFWQKGLDFAQEIIPFLDGEKAVIDIYFTSDKRTLIVDFNEWAGETSPLLLRDWERDWNEAAGLKLINPPHKLGGDVKVSF